jgi:hypothetical protein
MTAMDDETGRTTRRAALAIFAGLVPFALAGCGRRSLPKAPEGSTYNQPYPTRRSMGLPPEDRPPDAPKEDEDETPPAADPLRPPALRY